MKVKPTIIFDFDGTLANSLDLVFKLYNEHVDEFGYLPLDKSEFNDLRKLGYKKAMRRKKVKMRMLPKMLVVIGREMRRRMDEVLPYEGIVQVVEQLKKQGHTVGVLTSNQAPLVKEFFVKHSFPEFDFVVSEKTLFGKEKALRKIMKSYDLENDRVIYVGDEPRDVAACRRAKIPIVGVSWGLAGTEGYLKVQPDVLVHTPKELLNEVILYFENQA